MGNRLVVRVNEIDDERCVGSVVSGVVGRSRKSRPSLYLLLYVCHLSTSSLQLTLSSAESMWYCVLGVNSSI